MIKYALGCAEGHAFESWFPDSAAYEKQRKRGFVACPECGSTEVDKAIMAPAVVGGERAAGESRSARLSSTTGAGRRARFFARMRREIEANTDDVGAKFPRGGASHPSRRRARARDPRAAPASRKPRSLVEDGVGVFPLPMLEDELN